jgi:S1-C subfamily serine protease
LPGHDEIKATVVGRDALTDLAVLRVEGKSLRPLPVRVHPPRLGELCLAFGSPLGEYPESVSLGLVSGLSRSLPAGAGRAIHDVIQTDCAINPGNSGGPLIGVDGRVIGVNTAVRRDAAGIGFAVPADTVRTIVPELIRFGSVERATLGVGVAVRTLDGDPSGARRLVVTKPRGEAAGDLRRGDVLLAIDGFGVSSYADVTKILNRDRIGAEVPVAVWRDNREITVRCVPARLGQ